jgi:hypothetical protein
MFEQPQIPNTEELEKQKKSEMFFNFENITITPEQSYSFSAEAKKQPIEIKSGDVVGGNGIEVKIEGAVESVMKEAELLKELPEIERLSALLKLVREKLIYPYPKIRFGKTPRLSNAELNEFVSNGYGDCKVMAVLYLLGAQSAGLKGIYANSISPIKNLERPDTKQPIFKSIEINRDYTSGHAWVEIQLEDGSWVPVDISANMLGTNEMTQFFKDVGYNTPISFTDEELPKGVRLDRGSNYFKSGEAQTEVSMSLCIQNDFMTRKPMLPEFTGDINLKLSNNEDNKSVRVELSAIE